MPITFNIGIKMNMFVVNDDTIFFMDEDVVESKATIDKLPPVKKRNKPKPLQPNVPNKIIIGFKTILK